MKRHLSVLMLLARATVYKVLGLLALMAAAEVGLFCVLGRSWMANGSFELVVTHSGIAIVCAVCFVALCALLLLTNVLGSKTIYTTSRLRVSKEMVVVWQGVYNAGCFLAFWAVQALVVAGLAFLYTRSPVLTEPTAAGPQAVVLAIYNHSFLHAVLPLADVLCTARNLIMVLALGFGLSGGTQDLRRGGTVAFAVMLVAGAAVFFHVSVGNSTANILMCFGMAALGGAAVGNTLKGDAADE